MLLLGRVTVLHFGHNSCLISSICCSLISSSSSSVVFFDRSDLAKWSTCWADFPLLLSSWIFLKSWIVRVGALPYLFSLVASFGMLLVCSTSISCRGFENSYKSGVAIFALISGNGLVSTSIGFSAKFKIPLSMLSCITFWKIMQLLVEWCHELCHLQNSLPFKSATVGILWLLSSQINFYDI